MPYKFHEDLALADVAFEATGKNLDEMFESAALAVTNTMIKDLSSVEDTVRKKIKVKSDSLDNLLFNFLQELVFYKDSERLLFNKFSVKVDRKRLEVSCTAEGEELDMKKHELLADVKAVTFHNFKIEETEKGWKAEVILDV